MVDCLVATPPSVSETPSRASFFFPMHSVEKNTQGVNHLWLKAKKPLSAYAEIPEGLPCET